MPLERLVPTEAAGGCQDAQAIARSPVTSELSSGCRGMNSLVRPSLRVLAVGVASAMLGAVAVSRAQDAAPPPAVSAAAKISVEPRVTTPPGQPSPASVPGTGVRRGASVPSGAAVISYPITITVGAQRVLPTFQITCPGTKRLQGIANGGDLAPQIIGPDVFTRRRSFSYPGKRSWGVVVDYGSAASSGQVRRGAVHVLCR